MAVENPEPTTERCVHWRTYTELLSKAPKLPGTDLRVVPAGEWPTWPEEEISACPDPCHRQPGLAIVLTTYSGCGTVAGAQRHRRRGELPCPMCRFAEGDYHRAWRAARRAT